MLLQMQVQKFNKKILVTNIIIIIFINLMIGILVHILLDIAGVKEFRYIYILIHAIIAGIIIGFVIDYMELSFTESIDK